MSKRPREEPHGSGHKKHKHNTSTNSCHEHGTVKQSEKEPATYESKLQELEHRLPESNSSKAEVPAFVPFKTSKGLPELPQLSKDLAQAPFRHKSAYGYDRTSTACDMTYERLEFLGDAYLEVIASRLIFHHFPQLTAGSQSQLRELLVKNETLAEFARNYGFEARLDIADKQNFANDPRNRGNKGMNKILGDSFEAYVAAVILGDVEHGFAIAEKWLTNLWTPKLAEHAHAHLKISIDLVQDKDDDPLMNYNPTAKATLQQKLLASGIKLDYEPYRASVELKGDQLGQNRHYIAIYLTGYGHTRKLLGQGEGKNKVEAGNWAANQAIHGDNAGIVKECEAQLTAAREAKKKLKAEQDGG